MLLVLITVSPTWALTNGVALTPPMGWNSWYTFTDNINETLIRQMADAIATNGMKETGYEYVALDDCWSLGNDESGLPIVDTSKFPSGMAALGSYIHGKGLKFGLYTRCGEGPTHWGYRTPFGIGTNRTGYINTLASWGCDFLKVDLDPTTNSLQADFEAISQGIVACGRPMAYSICTGWFAPWMPACGNMWRTSNDWSFSNQFQVMLSILDQNNSTAWAAGPGQWNDPDMLMVGVAPAYFLMTDTEYRAHFTMWCIVAAPLIAANDVRSMTPAIKEILTAPEVISVDQAASGVQGTRISSVAGTGGALEVWRRPLGNNTNIQAVALLNRSTIAADITVYWTNLNLSSASAQVRDLWARTNLGTYANSYTATVPSHGVVLVRVAGSPPLISDIANTEGGVVIKGTDGPACSEYHVLTSTDLHLPSNLWEPTMTNRCDTKGNFSFTNALDLNA